MESMLKAEGLYDYMERTDRPSKAQYQRKIKIYGECGQNKKIGLLEYHCQKVSQSKATFMFSTRLLSIKGSRNGCLFWLYRTMIIDHTHEAYQKKRDKLGGGKYNGAFYYSKEIVKNIIPDIKTDRNWITILVPNVAMDHSIVFIHNNLYPEMYDYLKPYKDLILVCGIPSTCEKVKHLGTPIYLPLSIDTEYVSQFKRPKTKDTAYAGRKCKAKGIPQGTQMLPVVPRHRFLPIMAEYKNIYAVGRTAIEAKLLGCNILPYDQRFPKDIWQVLDNKDVIPMLQAELDRIDGYGEHGQPKATEHTNKG